LDPCVDDVFDSESALELNPEVVTLTPGTLCIVHRNADGKTSVKHYLSYYASLSHSYIELKVSRLI